RLCNGLAIYSCAREAYGKICFAEKEMFSAGFLFCFSNWVRGYGTTRRWARGGRRSRERAFNTFPILRNGTRCNGANFMTYGIAITSIHYFWRRLCGRAIPLSRRRRGRRLLHWSSAHPTGGGRLRRFSPLPVPVPWTIGPRQPPLPPHL